MDLCLGIATLVPGQIRKREGKKPTMLEIQCKPLQQLKTSFDGHAFIMLSRVQPSNRGSSFPGSNNCTKLAGGFDSSAAAKQTFLSDKVAFVQL